MLLGLHSQAQGLIVYKTNHCLINVFYTYICTLFVFTVHSSIKTVLLCTIRYVKYDLYYYMVITVLLNILIANYHMH